MANKTIGELTAVTDVIGSDEYAVFRSGVTQKITADDLLAAAAGGVAELAYAQVTSNVTITGTTEAAPTDVVSLGSVTYEAVPTLIEFYCPLSYVSVADSAVILLLFDGSTMLCRFADVRADLTSTPPGTPVFASIRITPSAGAHTYNVKALKSSGATVDLYGGAGTGGAGVYAPMSMRASRATGTSEATTDGWTGAGETWTYASADSPTFTFTVAADVTTKYSAGMRVKLTQTTAKYFIVTKVSTFSGGNTTITVYGGTDYTLANAAITSPFYSVVKAPFGFPLDPAKWTLTFSDTSFQQQTSPAAGTWYNPNSDSLVVHIGTWVLSYRCALGFYESGSSAIRGVNSTLSTANNSESDADRTAFVGGGDVKLATGTVASSKPVTLTAKTTYYLNIKTGDSGIGSIRTVGSQSPTIIAAVCAYL